MTALDLIDRKIVATLMSDATLSIAQVAEKVGLSQSPCWKRIQKLEANGILTGRVAIVDPARIGFGLTVFVSVEAKDHSAEWREQFLQAIADFPEIMEAYRMAGEKDYLLRVAVPDIGTFDDFYRRLTEAVTFRNLSSHFAMERLRYSTVFPVNTRDR